MKSVNQSCQNCCFAVTVSEAIHNPLKTTVGLPTQTECMAGYLDKFRKKGEDVVLEAENELGEFFVIDGYKCPAYRNWKEPDLEKLKSQLKLQVDMFVLCTPLDSELSIVKTILSINQQIDKPRSVQILLTRNIEDGKRVGLTPSKLFRAIDTLELNVSVSESLNEATPLEVLDRVLIGNDSAYYSVCLPDETYRADFLSRLNSLVFDEFENFIMITKTNETPDLINTKLHHTFGGNRDGKTIQEKLKILDKQQIWTDTKISGDGENLKSNDKRPWVSYIKEGGALWNIQK